MKITVRFDRVLNTVIGWLWQGTVFINAFKISVRIFHKTHRQLLEDYSMDNAKDYIIIMLPIHVVYKCAYNSTRRDENFISRSTLAESVKTIAKRSMTSSPVIKVLKGWHFNPFSFLDRHCLLVNPCPSELEHKLILRTGWQRQNLTNIQSRMSPLQRP